MPFLFVLDQGAIDSRTIVFDKNLQTLSTAQQCVKDPSVDRPQ